MQGKKKYCLLLLFCCCSLTFGQSTDSVSVTHKLEIGASLFYYHPNLDDFNKGFAKLEQDLKLSPLWSDFKISYLVLPTVVYHLNPKTQIALQVGGSYLERTSNDNKSYYFLWMIGGEYRHVPLSFSMMHVPADLSVSLGAGMVGAKFRRSYEGDVVIKEFTSNIYIHAGTTLSMDLTKRLGIHVDLRYLFIPTTKIDNLKSDLSLKSVMAGIGVYYSL
jgi:hypothetical protein